jgi:hypothetical protein
MQNHKDKQAIVWDSDILKNTQGQIVVKISDKEWATIAPKLEEVLLGIPNDWCELQSETDFQNRLADVIENSCPVLSQKAMAVSEKINGGYRFCLLQGLKFDELDEKSRGLLILGFCCMIGKPTYTDKVKRTVLWPVKPEEVQTVKNTTFSQRTGEAAYHTDTQYLEKPEKYMSLWCVNPDRNGGGVSGLLDGRKVISEIIERYGSDVIETLSNSLFPFRVPSVFTSRGDDTNTEIFYGPIINSVDATKPLIRYRKETLEKGLTAKGEVLGDSQKYALDCIENVLQDSNLEFRHFLKKGDVIFADNHELLHMRTYFDDMERFLIRVRFN